MQTRFMAGYLYHNLYSKLHKSNRFRSAMLDAAKHNLNQCVAFGIQSQFEASAKLIQKRMNWTEYTPSDVKVAKTKQKPSLQEINSYNNKVIPSLQESHCLDRELYRYAVDLFATATHAEGIALKSQTETAELRPG